MVIFKQFLGEKEQIKSEEFALARTIQWCEKYASGFLAQGHPIYRAMKQTIDYGYLDSNDFTRESKNTVNYYNLWMSEDSSWSDYPKRSKSHIATMRVASAEGYYGNIYLMIPADTDKIGICKKSDLWYSCEPFLKAAEFDSRSLSPYVESLQSMFESISRTTEVFSGPDVDQAEKSYEGLVKILKACTEQVIARTLKKIQTEGGDESLFLRRHLDFMRRTLNALHDTSSNSLYTLFSNYLTPEKNKFEWTFARNFDIDENLYQEVWIQGSAAIIRLSTIQATSDGTNPELRDFMQKYFKRTVL